MPRAFGSLVLLALIAACGTPPSTSEGNELPPGSNVDIGEPIAEVNGFPIGSREFEAAYAEGGIFQLTMHPHVTGYRSRIWIFEDLVKQAKAKGDVWFATHAEIVDWVKANA